MIISLEKITKVYNGVTVLDNTGLIIENNDRIGLTGINGCGKSTLLRIITGLENPENTPPPNEAKIYKNKDAAIGYLAQNSGVDGSGGNTVYQEIRSVFASLDKAAGRLKEIETGMDESHAEEYSSLTAFYEANDGYLIDVKINKVLNGMNFAPDMVERPVSALSGGEKTRLALAKLLLENPALLILDEPTNHLDFNTVMWLEDYLKEYKGALLIVSHDRYFLDKLCTSVCEIERGRLRRFKGNYSAFTKQKQELTERGLKEYKAQQNEIAKLEDYVARNLVRASTSNMAKSRVKRLEAMDIIEKPVMYEKPAKIKFTYKITPPLDILKIKEIDISAGTGESRKTIIDSLSLEIRRGDKIGITGVNGSGKSTFLKVIQGILPAQKGEIRWAENVKISYFDQSNERLSRNDTVINAVHSRFRRMNEAEIRTLLGSVRLTGENVFKKVGALSGGERAKLYFALMMLESGNVLILDEPTNHLDISAREGIETALSAFDGTVIFVSHDRYLLNKLSARILEFTGENHVRLYEGGYEEFMDFKRKEISSKPVIPVPKKEKPDKPYYRTKQKRAEEVKKLQRIKALEAEIERHETEISSLEAEICSPEVCADYVLLKEKCDLLEAVKLNLNKITDEWLVLNNE
ncbi:MAG: ABC-F family ATP-binding cassette domain-containing protein [Oscillospiraceae bacterium]|nr:ABC-F family ATP-binding cassette domain-containing protein [Oscillospiraceae bacterium]